MPRSARHLFVLGLTLLLALPAALAQAAQYTSVVVFGDSLSDTGNDATLTTLKYGVPVPGPIADYTLGRFTDGPDTLPPARNYIGVWVEQLAALLPAHPAIRNSLAGGSNYAFGFALTGPGTSTLPLGSTGLSISVQNIGLQISTYLATRPHIDSHTLFIVWGGANDVLTATSFGTVGTAAVQELAGIQRLIAAGATQFLIPNLPPLGAIPRLNASYAISVPATEASAFFNANLAIGLSVLHAIAPRTVIRQLDIFSLFKSVIASPSTYALLNVTTSSQGKPVDPDYFLFWDDLHPTTRGHNLIALNALKVLDTPVTPPAKALLTHTAR